MSEARVINLAEALEARLARCEAILRAAGLDGARGEAMLPQRQFITASAEDAARRAAHDQVMLRQQKSSRTEER